VHDKLTTLPLLHLKSVTLDHFIAKNAAAHKANSYYTLAMHILCRKTHYLGPEITTHYILRVYSIKTVQARFTESLLSAPRKTLLRGPVKFFFPEIPEIRKRLPRSRALNERDCGKLAIFNQ